MTFCRDTSRNATEEKDVVGGSCFRHNRDNLISETFCRLIVGDGVLDAIWPRVDAKIDLFLGQE
jgi:hypothetical protein